MSFCCACVATFTHNSFRIGGNPGDPAEDIVPHHRTLEDFVSAVHAKCQLCSQVHRHLRTQEQSMLEELIRQMAPLPINETSRNPGHAMQLLWNLEWTDTKPRTPILSIIIRLGDLFRDVIDDPEDLDPNSAVKLDLESRKRLIRIENRLARHAVRFIPTRDMDKFPMQVPQAKNTGSEAALMTVSEWLSECIAGHSRCAQQQSGTESFYPTRLIDVGRSPDMFYVVDGQCLPQGELYNTLSHRWAPVEKLLLTTENQRQLQNGSLISGLSKTFQEAIIVSRYLSVRYLWIDCLCILQAGDSGEDWESEALRMAEVYKNAHVNISADEGSDVHGLFFERDPQRYAQVSLELHIDAAAGISEWTSIKKGMWATEVNRSPLNERGWVFQERVLVPRVVHFCRQEIFWECRERSLCESFPKELPSPDFFDLDDSVSLRRLELWEGSTWLSDDRFPIYDVAYEVWDDIVKAYTKCQLSNPTDKLIALAGVAKHMKSIINDTYVAGMWLKRLAAELAWWVDPRREKYIFRQEPSYYAPSFSWASVKGQINSFGPFAPGILVDVACVPLADGNPGRKLFTDDEFGLLRSPSFKLRVTGYLKVARLRKIARQWRMAPISTYRTDGEGESDISSFCFPPYLDFDIETLDQAAFEAETFYFMPWRYGPSSEGDAMERSLAHCMLLQLLDRDTRQFRRIGWVITAQPALVKILLDEDSGEEPTTAFGVAPGRQIIFII